ncbi:hypothetical protein AL540_005940 [Vibrio harveyi]|nr:hypothetical protein AL540_005940 [Vibrio harveyi]SQA36262.1 Uncharacterised protein [Vibrio harveyi]
MFDSGLACAVGDGSDYAIAKVALKESDMNKDMMAIVSLDTSGNLNLNVMGSHKLNESNSIKIGSSIAVDNSDIYRKRCFR